MEPIDKKNKKDEDENLSDSSAKSSSDDEITPTKKQEPKQNNNKTKSSRNNKKKSKPTIKSSDEDDLSDSEMSDVKSESSKESKSIRTNNNNNIKKVKYSSGEESSGENSSDDEEEEDEEDSSADSSSDSEEDSDSGEEFELSESDENSDEDDDDEDDEDYFEFNRRSKRIKKAKKKAASVNNKKNSSRYPQRQPNNKNNKKNSSTKKASSTRSASNKKINYCEDSDDDLTDSEDIIYSNEPVTQDTAKLEDQNVETIEKVLKCRYGKVGATGSKTAVYNIEEHGDPNDNFDKEGEQGENQYFIKWLGWSHLHNTWESKESLLQQRVKGIKKLENFLKKEEENRQGVMDPSSPEDLEFLECQNEMLDNLLETHRNVERIIASNLVKNPNGTVNEDYLCKWQGLPYSECTWEDGDLIKKRFPILIEEYEKRQNLTTLPPINVKTQRVLKMRPKFVALKEKPEYLGNYDPELKLRDYQLDGLNWLANSWCKQNSVILADEMGLGKTIQTISFISYVFNEHSLYGPFLIVIPLSTIQGWQRELQKWSPEINVVVYLGDATSRNMIQKYEWYSTNRKIKANVVLTTYEILLKDKSFFNSVSWAVLIVDEAHRLKNEDSLLYQSLIKFDTNHRLLITGTPLQNSLKELWALIHFIMPEKFYSWEEFDEKYSSVLQDGLRFQDLHKELQPYLLRRVKKDVEKSLPSKVEQILRVEMTNVQKQYYKLVLTKNYKELSKGAKGNVNSFLNIMMELKKCSNHIYLIRRDDNTVDMEKLIKGSGKLLLLDKLLRRLKETGHRVLIFSQMVRMLDILAEYLQYRRFQFQRLDGSIKGEVRRQALDHFNKEDSEDFCFLLSTRAGGLGINLATADTVIIYDSDWNPQNDLQAQARAHRIGQKNQVNIYRLVSKNSIEEDIVERAKKKMVLDHLVIQSMDTTGRTVLNKSNSTMAFTKEEVNSILKFGAEELFKEKDPANEQQDEKEELNMYDIDEILKRAETREEDNHQSASDDFLSQFKVANFSTVEDDPILPTKSFASNSNSNNQIEKTWNEIIPEEDRLRAEMEEENEKINLLNLTLGQRRNRGGTSNNKNKNSQSDDEANTTLKNECNNSEDEDDYYDEFDKSNKKRNKKSSQYSIKDLNGPELRRFIRSYRKFPSPIDRIDIISQDAHLEEKSQACLIEIAKKLQDLCKTAIANYETKVKAEEQKEKQQNESNNNNNNNNNKKQNDKERGPNIILNGVKLNAQQILEAETYFQPLTHYIKESASKSIEFKTKLKQTYWDCEWNEDDDKSLLIGIYDYGYGNWDWIKADPKLNLDKKILISKMDDNNNSDETGTASSSAPTNSNSKSNKNIKLKPQSKHLRTRIDYLVKVLKNQINVEKYGDNWKENNKNISSSNKKSKKKSKSSNNKKNNEDSVNLNNHNENSFNNSMDVAETTISLNESNTVRSNKRKLNSKSYSGDSHSQSSKSKRKNPHNSHLSSEFVNRDSDESENSETNHENNHKKKRNHNNSHHHNHHHNTDSNMSNSQIDEEINSDTEISHNSKPSKKQDPKSKEPSKDKKIILDEKTFNECKNLMRPVKKALKNIDVKDGKIEKEDFERVKRHLLEIGDKINDHLTKYSDANKIKEWRNNLWIFVSKFTTMSYDRLKQLYIKFASTRDQEEINKQMTSSISSGGNSANNNSSNRYNSATSHNSSSSYNKYNNNHEHKQRSSNSDFWKNEKYFDTKHKNYNNSLSNNYSNNSSSNRHSFSNYHHSSFDHDNFNHSFNGFDSYPDNHDHKNFSSPGSSHFFSKKNSFNSNSNNHMNKFNNYPHHTHNHHSHQHQQQHHHHHHQKTPKGPKD